MTRHLCRVVWCGLCLLAGSAGAATGTTNGLASGVQAFNTAFEAWSYEGFVASAERFAAEARLAPASFPAFYWQGVATFHAALCAGASDGAADRRRAAARLREAGSAFESALRLKPDDAECHALMSSVIGMEIARHPASALWRGPRVLRHQRLALRNGPDNPRVHYLIGCGYYHAPSILGDRQQALAHFLKAEPFFDREAEEPADPLQPRWGRSSCLTFIGSLHEASGDRGKAEQYYRKALRANPHDRLAQQALAGKKAETKAR
jgi:tetratricopeptide (TPR) repeat protein